LPRSGICAAMAALVNGRPDPRHPAHGGEMCAHLGDGVIQRARVGRGRATVTCAGMHSRTPNAISRAEAGHAGDERMQGMRQVGNVKLSRNESSVRTIFRPDTNDIFINFKLCNCRRARAGSFCAGQAPGEERSWQLSEKGITQKAPAIRQDWRSSDRFISRRRDGFHISVSRPTAIRPNSPPLYPSHSRRNSTW